MQVQMQWPINDNPGITILYKTLTCMLSEDHGALSKYVTTSEKEDTMSWLSVSPSSSTLLVVVLHGLAERVMNDKSNI